MKPGFFRIPDLLWCVVPVVCYAILFQVMVHTRLIEQVMTQTFSWWELLLIIGFLVSRIVTYLLVPPVLVAAGVYGLVRRMLRQRAS